MDLLFEEDGCTDDCAIHADNCDGFCDHGEDHMNGCFVNPYIGI